jgi:protoporphyrinogen oxidase
MTIGILGGGLSGLVVAGHANDHTEILEMDDHPGGHCRSLVRDGYTFDVGGPHIMFSRDQDILGGMVERLDGNVVNMRRNNKIFHHGRYVKYPFENGLYDLAPEDRFECLYHYLHNDHPEPAHFGEWVYFTFGAGIAEKYMIPYNEKIWNVVASEMSMDWVEGRIPKPPVEDVIKAAVGVETEGHTHQLHFSYPRTGGIESLMKGYARDCRRIVTGFRVSRVWREDGLWHVGDGNTVRRYERLVSTIPVQDLLQALPDVPEEVLRWVQALRFNSLIVAMLGVETEAPLPYTAVYVADPSVPFHRVSFPLNFSPEAAPPGCMAVSAEITTNPGDGFHELDDEAVLESVIKGLAGMGVIDKARINFRAVHRTRHAYAVPTFGYRQNLARVMEYMDGLGIVSVGRNAEFEYINMDEAVRRGLAAAERLEREQP